MKGAAAAERIVRKTPHQMVRDYLGYWVRLIPRGHEEYYHRWLFSYMSIRQRWEDNVRGFQILKALPRPFTVREVGDALREGRLGMFNDRAVRLTDFSKSFWEDPESWYPQPGETLRDCRNRLGHRLQGLGRAKVSFVLEMLCPAASEVVCLDSHMLKLYGYEPTDSPTEREYVKAEDHWMSLCRHLRKPSPMVRHAYWDRLRGKENTRYWSYVFERPGEEYGPVPTVQRQLRPLPDESSAGQQLH
jgi:hypothetical protein